MKPEAKPLSDREKQQLKNLHTLQYMGELKPHEQDVLQALESRKAALEAVEKPAN